ncbi:hypothetical protein F2Q70_00015387 [Brassica cretica]|uniref:Uncharacterized protein n=1 Tax=Brassica cretica TaxID=69181 RepID=A0A8S9HXG7_BRACR|nr:hypothetical protein F2Q70_00015387 [Brassica cretica]
MKRFEKKIHEDDPLFGVVAKSQVGTLPGTSTEKIAPVVLEGMRQYLTVVEGPEKVARKERIERSLMDLENDPLGQKTFLRLEPAPIVTTKLDKQKGLVFDFQLQEQEGRSVKARLGGKLMAGAIQAGMATCSLPKEFSLAYDHKNFQVSTLPGPK